MPVYNIKSSVLNRLVKVCSYFEPTTPDHIKEKINTVRLENKNGKTFAISTNQKIASVEYVCQTLESDSFTHLILTDQLLQQLSIEANSDDIITLTAIPEMNMSVLQSTSGFTTANCCYWWTDTPLNHWREWAGNNVKSNKGVMTWTLRHVETLIKSSPSGKVLFPKFIDSDAPCILRDEKYSTWAGLFIPGDKNQLKNKKGAELPKWWNE